MKTDCPSPLIYDRLVRYKTVIPMDNAAFGQHAGIVNPRGVRKGRNPNFGEGWYYGWVSKYDRTHGVAAQAALDEIIDTYFPDGRPPSTREAKLPVDKSTLTHVR